jgi:nitroreductase
MDPMNEALKIIYERKSVRSYTEEKIPEDIIREIVKAGTHAPNGMNAQALRFVIVTNRTVMKSYSDQAKHLFVEMVKKGGPSSEAKLQRMKMLLDPDFDLFYGAPVLVFVFAAPNALTPVEDGSLAAENMFLAAHSFGLGSCWIGFASQLMTSPDFVKETSVPTDHRLIGSLVFGYPKGDRPPTPREEPKIINWLR